MAPQLEVPVRQIEWFRFNGTPRSALPTGCLPGGKPRPLGAGAIALLVMAVVAAGVAIARAGDAPQGKRAAPYAAEMNKKFTDSSVDIQEFVKRFENEARDVYVKRRDITRAVGLRRGDAVADVGAGTGLFTQLFAEQVGPKGTVYAVDIGPAFVKYIAEEAKQRGHERVVKTVLNTPDSAELPPGSIDVAFLCDTYHHFEHPEKMLASIHRALRPGGRLIVIDFDLGKNSGEFVKQRARAAKEVYYREIAAAGFERIETKDAPAIKDNFYAEFRRVAAGEGDAASKPGAAEKPKGGWGRASAMPPKARLAGRPVWRLACRVSNYGTYHASACTHLPSIGVRHVFLSPRSP